MIHTSSAYKRIMAQKLRNRGYVSISLGVINSLAQEGATVTSDVASWSTGDIFKTKHTAKVEYAFLEEKSIPCDGSMLFMPEVDQYLDNGVCAPNVGDSIVVTLNRNHTVKGITIDFGTNYPTEFTIRAGGVDHVVTNNKPVYQNTTLVLYNISSIEIKDATMLYPNQRLRIKSMLMGVGLYFDDAVVQSVTCEGYVSPISENVSYQNNTINIYDTQHQFDVDNPESFMQFLEPLQLVEISIGVDLGNNEKEWVKMCTAYLQSWNVKKNILTLVATDKLSQLRNTFSLSNTIHTRTAYAELELILQDAGFAQDEYEIDSYLQNVILTNPIPECLHREAIQLVCNATRCIAYEDENGVMRIIANFAEVVEPDDVIVSNSATTAWADMDNITSDSFVEYVDLSSNMGKLDDSQIILPTVASAYEKHTGFVSEGLADANGEFTSNPYVEFVLPASFAYYSLTMQFGGVVPSEVVIRTYNNSVMNGEYTITELSETTTAVLENYVAFDKIRVEVTETEPNARVLIKSIRFGSTSSYYLSDELLTDYIHSTKDDRIRDVRVKVFTFENDEQDKPKQVDDSVYVTNSLALTGIDKTCENQLIGTSAQAEVLAEWLANYYKNNINYDVTFRGEPTLQAGDTIQLYNEFKNNLQAKIEKTTFTFNGAFSGKLALRRTAKLNEEE